jgi:hypothetical protein
VRESNWFLPVVVNTLTGRTGSGGATSSAFPHPTMTKAKDNNSMIFFID